MPAAFAADGRRSLLAQSRRRQGRDPTARPRHQAQAQADDAFRPDPAWKPLGNATSGSTRPPSAPCSGHASASGRGSSNTSSA